MLEDVSIIYNSNRVKFQSIVFGFRDDIDLILYSRLIGVSLVSFPKSTCRSKAIQLLLLYKNGVVTVATFCRWLQQFILDNHVDIILRF